MKLQILLYYTARPYGCTSTILFQDFKGKGIEINREEAILMASAIISDTLLLKSPTTTKHDEKSVRRIRKKIAGIDIKRIWFGNVKSRNRFR